VAMRRLLEPTGQGTRPSRQQKLMSCVVRTGQRLSEPVHVIDVLIGKENDKIAKARARYVSKFGIGGELTDMQWRSVIRHNWLVRGTCAPRSIDTDRDRNYHMSRPLLRGDVDVAPARSRRCRYDRASAAARAPPVPRKTRGFGTPAPVPKELADAQRRAAVCGFPRRTLADDAAPAAHDRRAARCQRAVGTRRKLREIRERVLRVIRARGHENAERRGGLSSRRASRYT